MPGPRNRPLQPGALPAGFEFVRVLGAGADGWVCLARDVALDRLVAVKTVLGGALVPGGSGRLAREGKVLASLQHPHVVRVHRLVTIGEDVALCEEFVDGPTLAQALRDPSHELQAPGPGRLRLLWEVTEALEHCAQRGVVHRDLKPGNILLTGQGAAKVADFGLARLSLAAAAFRTAPGVASGTPGYWAPEQVRQPDLEHPAADHHSFAVVALECLTREDVGAAGPGALLELLPPALRPAFRGGLAVDPGARWSPRQLMGAITANGWLGIPAPRRAARGMGTVSSSGLTTQAAPDTWAGAPEPEWIPRLPLSLEPVATVPTQPSPNVGPPPTSLPLQWVQPATVSITDVPWWRRHPRAVGLAAGIVITTIIVTVLGLVAR
jgi:serine/threonine protein kinase